MTAEKLTFVDLMAVHFDKLQLHDRQISITELIRWNGVGTIGARVCVRAYVRIWHHKFFSRVSSNQHRTISFDHWSTTRSDKQ